MKQVLTGPTPCIIGAGPAGLAMARALSERGVTYTHLERHTAVGGIWDLENPGTPMYESAHFISSKTLSGFGGFPMPDAFPDYPTREQILAYLRSFADSFGLTDHIEYGEEVEVIQRRDAGTWVVTRKSGGISEHSDVIVCAGTQWHPRRPTLPGHFTGEIRHSQTYSSTEELRGKRVLIIGAGNSGVDIACDAARVAASATISMRRGYWVIPKHLFGIPVDVIGSAGPQPPARLQSKIFGLLLRLVEGDLRSSGLQKPDHRLLETHPIVNSLMLHHLRHGDLTARPDVTGIHGSTVEFADGTSGEFDLIITATGYEQRVPFASAYFGDDHPDLYLSAFSREHPGLHAVGFVETNSAAYGLFDQLSQLVANYVLERFAATPSAAAFARRIQEDEPDLTGGLRFVKSPRHHGYVNSHTFERYLAKVAKLQGWRGVGEPPKAKAKQGRPV